MGNYDSVVKKEVLPDANLYHVALYQVEDGTIFYRETGRYVSNADHHRLYVKWQGNEVEARLNKGCKTYSCVAHGNKLYVVMEEALEKSKRVTSASFSPSSGLTISYVRNAREGEEFYVGGVCSRVRDGRKYYSRICDDQERCKMEIDKEHTFKYLIHRGRAVHIDPRTSVPFEYSTLKSPIVRSWTDHSIVIEMAQQSALTTTSISALDSAPFIYIVQNGVPHILNTDTMKFVPATWLQVEYFFEIYEIVGIREDMAYVTGTKTEMFKTYRCFMQIQLPDSLGKDSEFVSEFLLKFEPRKILGKGTFGCVFEAQNKLDKWSYAVKRIAVRGSEDEVQRALQEVCALASLKHEGIIGYNSCWMEKPPPGWQKRTDAKLQNKLGLEESPQNYKNDCMFIYIQMELCKQSLNDWLYANKTRELAQAKSWFKQLVSAVGYLHQKNKIHRDLKPLNILFDMEGRIKICDLGLVTNRVLTNGQEIDLTRTIAGTPMYMAPEQIEGNYTSKVDVYSLGLILAELCVCMTIERAHEAFMCYRRGRPTTILKHLPEVDRLVSWMTNVGASKRPTCEEILANKFLA